MLDAYGFEVPLEREREYKEWSRRYYKPARNSAEEAQVRAWLLHLVKFKGDECAAYLRSPELTALVRRGIPSEHAHGRLHLPYQSAAGRADANGARTARRDERAHARDVARQVGTAAAAAVKKDHCILRHTLG